MAVFLVLDLLNRDECKNILSRLLKVVDHIDRIWELNINVVIKNVLLIMLHMKERKTGDII